MRKLSKKISMLMVLAMLVGLFSGVVSASAASAWSFKSKNYNVAVDGTVVMGNKEYADFDLLKDGKAPTGYTVTWASSDENVVWVNAKTGQLRVNKLGMANIGDKAVISATFTNTATKKSATRSFVIAYGTPEYDYVIKSGDIVLGEETLTVGESYKLSTTVLDEAGNSVDFKTCKLYRNYFIDGKEIANPYVPEKEGKVTIVVGAFTTKADMKDLSKAVDSKTVEVEAKIGGFSAKPSKIKEITVTGEFAKDSTFTVKKDGVIKIDVEAKVADDLKSATLTLVNSRISKGTYTVTCGDAEAEFNAEDEKVESIVILENNGQAYTDPTRSFAYAHYDVFNQYDESIRERVSVSFVSSADRLPTYTTTGDPNTGIVTMTTNATTSPFNYGNVLVLTATVLNYNGTTKTATANMTVGLQNNIHTIAVKGVVLDGTNELLDAVPVEFVGGNYYMVFECYDRNGNVMQYNSANAYNDLTFTSVSPLLSGIQNKAVKSVFIDGVEYGMVRLSMGQDAKQGGYIDIKVTSQSGGVSDVKVRVTSNQILQSFRVIKPEGVISVTKTDGSGTDIELKYEALDTEGKKITDFRALYEAVAFSDGRVRLVEKDDGSAKLMVNFAGLPASKQVDAQLIFSVIIPKFAKAENVTLNVKYARHADAIGTYEGNFEVLEGDTNGIVIGLAHTDYDTNAKVNFIDQYDEVIGHGAFGGYKVAAKVVADGGAWISGVYVPGISLSRGVTGAAYAGTYTNVYNPGTKDRIQITAAHVTEDVSDAVIELALIDPNNNLVEGSARKFTIKIVDLSQVNSFSISPAWNGGFDQSKLENGIETTGNYEVFGYLANGHKVCIPLNGIAEGSSFVEFAVNSYGSYGNVYPASATGASLNIIPSFDVDNPNNTTGSALKIFQDKSRYDVEGNYAVVNRDITVNAKIFTIDSGAVATGGKTYKGSANNTVTVGVYRRATESVIVKAPTAVVNANNGVINYADLVAKLDKIVDNYGDNVNYCEVGTMDGSALRKDLTLTISNFKEGKKGLDFDNAVIVCGEQTGVRKNQPNDKNEANKEYAKIPMILCAEIGDTFTVTYECEGKTASVDFTVGADKTATFFTINPGLSWY